jgi:hypothetical protein
MKLSIFASTSALLFSLIQSAAAWDGENTETGSSVEIEKGQLVREGRTVEYYDYEKGEYREMDVDDMTSNHSGGVTIEGADSETGETIEIEMED